jgi:spermidine synthase
MPDRKFSSGRVALLVFFSGACALVYQIAWLRELRLIFGASTAASAAVLAVFMGGLGAGGLVFGKRVDESDNALAFYARLEAGVAVTAAVTPWLVRLAQLVYLGVGGGSTLGGVGATVLRLLLTALVLGPSVVLMGGTLPGAARAVERLGDAGRQEVARLYGVNTLGAVLGTLGANFVLLEVFGTRLTLWLACLVNALVALTARAVSRRPASRHGSDPVEPRRENGEGDEGERADEASGQTGKDVSASVEVPRFPPFAAAIAGATFMLMELVWYRMLAPLLGGSSYTFGLILAVALAGVGLGGLAYSRTKRPARMTLFGMTAAVEALAIVLPFALGDRIAILALLLRPLAQASFAASVLAWTIVASIVVLPASIVAGYQFPVIIGLYGRGPRSVGRHVGHAYLANTIGSILGSVVGGFGLLPLLSAPRCWKLVAMTLVLVALLATAVDIRTLRRITAVSAASAAAAAVASLLLLASGPTAVWRHSGIGAGRADLTEVTRERLDELVAKVNYELAWEEEGLESSIALARTSNGYAFVVNGKVDGSIRFDVGTQVMGGVLPALLHEKVETALVIGLGTGSTAGWLGLIPSVERVDVVELEPAIVRVARDCAAANGAVMDNPKVKVTIGDAREVLRTTNEKYDLVFSEPSNPYRAGISSLYTVEFYLAAADRLKDRGIFVQWVQAYEVAPVAVATAAVTLRQVFPTVTIWQTAGGDLVLMGSRERIPIDVARLRKLLATEPFRSAARNAWKTDSAEGVLARFIAGPAFVDLLADQRLGVVNTDDQNFLEFAFAKTVGVRRNVIAEIRALVARLDMQRPDVIGPVDASLLAEETMHMGMLDDSPVPPTSTRVERRPYANMLRLMVREDDYEGFLAAWSTLGRTPRSYYERLLLAHAAARAGDDRADALIAEMPSTSDRELLRGIALLRRGRTAEDSFERGFVAARSDPWTHTSTMLVSLSLVAELGTRGRAVARRFVHVLREPFAAEVFRTERLDALVRLVRTTRDPEICVDVMDGIGALPMLLRMHEARVECYEVASDPRLPRARADLARIQAYRLPFGSDLPSAPTPRGPPSSAAFDTHPMEDATDAAPRDVGLARDSGLPRDASVATSAASDGGADGKSASQ